MSCPFRTLEIMALHKFFSCIICLLPRLLRKDSVASHCLLLDLLPTKGRVPSPPWNLTYSWVDILLIVAFLFFNIYELREAMFKTEISFERKTSFMLT